MREGGIVGAVGDKAGSLEQSDKNGVSISAIQIEL